MRFLEDGGPHVDAGRGDELIESVFLPKRPPRSGDAYLRFIPRSEMDIAVVGVSVNSEERHQAFRQKHQLPFALASDDSGDIGASYGLSFYDIHWRKATRDNLSFVASFGLPNRHALNAAFLPVAASATCRESSRCPGRPRKKAQHTEE